jgi:hypothetical protein
LDREECYKQTEGPITIVYGIKQKCEGPFQATDTEGAKISPHTGAVTQNYL